MDVHRNAAAVVANGDRAIDVDGDFDFRAMAGEMFVDGVVQHFGNAMVQRAFVGAADIHAGLLADGFQALQFAELGRAVSLIWIRRGGHRFPGLKFRFRWT